MGIFSWLKGRKNVAPVPDPVRSPMGFQTGSLQGLGSRDSQEDAFFLLNDRDVLKIQEEGLFAVVADGMGGMADGRAASSAAVSSLAESFSRMDWKKDPASQLENAVRLAGDRVCRLLEGQGGSTAVACMIHDGRLWFASVGDSGLYLLRDHQLNRLNLPHNLRYQIYLRELRAGNMDPSAGRNHLETNALTSFLGMEEMEEVDLLRRPLLLASGDVLLLCSDGISGALTEDLLTACLEQETPRYICTAMEQEILKRALPHQDNYTAVVIRCVQ